jgi:uncharacterized phage protein (TIGR01671 family)
MELGMNRLRDSEIKFRAYDDTLRKMMKPLTLEEIFKGNFGNTNLYQLTMMQYTGLKDANGTEIYEGDILANTTAYYVYVVDSSNTVKPMLNYVKMAERCPAKMPKYPSQTFAEFNRVDDSIVIGNVLENSDIIGGQPWQS